MDSPGSFVTKKIWELNIHINLASCVAAYTFGVFNSCQQNVSASLYWGANENLFITLFSALIPVGAVIGSIFAGIFVHKLGRRGTIMWIDAVYVFGTVILVIPSTVAFGIGRLVTGFCIGVFMTAAPIFLAEVTPESMMSKIGPLIVICDNVGLFLSFTTALALPTKHFTTDPFNSWWLFMFIFPACICFYQLCYFKFFHKNDSPQYYHSKGMQSETISALQNTYTDKGIGEGLRRVDTEVQSKLGDDKKIGIKVLFKEKRFRKMMRDGNLLCLFNQLSGREVIILYSSMIFDGFGGDVFVSRLLTALVAVVSLASYVITYFLIDLLGRKTIIVSGHFLLCLDLVLLGLFSEYVDEGVAVPAALIMVYVVIYCCCLETTFWMYLSEILNDQIYGISCATYMITIVGTSFLFPLAKDYFGTGNCFLFFSMFMMIGGIYSSICLVETKGVDKEEILRRMSAINETVLPLSGSVEDRIQENCLVIDQKMRVVEKYSISTKESKEFNDIFFDNREKPLKSYKHHESETNEEESGFNKVAT